MRYRAQVTLVAIAVAVAGCGASSTEITVETSVEVASPVVIEIENGAFHPSQVELTASDSGLVEFHNLDSTAYEVVATGGDFGRFVVEPGEIHTIDFAQIEPGVIRYSSQVALSVFGGFVDNTELVPPQASPTVVVEPPAPGVPLPGRIAYIEGSDVVVVNADGSDRETIVAFGDNSWPTWSPDGRQIAYACGGNLCVANADETSDVFRAEVITADFRISWPAWSPDGTSIAFSSDSGGDHGLYLLDLTALTISLVVDGEGVEGQAAWSPDGDQLVYAWNRGGDTDLYVISVDGGEPQRLVSNGGSQLAPAWSPDGSTIAFASNEDGDFEIMLVDQDGGNLRRVTDNDVREGRPGWSPDGSRLVFDAEWSGNCEGSTDVYTMNVDGSRPLHATCAPGPDYSPTWNPIP